MDKIFWGFSEDVAAFDKSEFKRFLESNDLKDACTKNGRLKHIIKAEHFDLNFLKTICETAHAARKIHKLKDNYLKGLLKSKSVLNFFSQPSTRTFLSFSTAEAHLGIRREDIRDIKTSSIVKGESDKDGLRTQSSYFNAIVARHPSDMFDQFAVWALKNSDREIPFINAGSGTKEHPTQAILDYYTCWASFNGNLDNKVFVMAGDPKRSRTIHSRSRLFALHHNVTLIYVAPEENQIDEETVKYVKARGATVKKVTTGLKDVIEIADEINVTRLQSEYGGGEEQLYPEAFVFKKEYLDLMKDDAILTHPLPKRNEIDPAIDYLKKNPKVMYWRALRNGMWTRVALLAYLFNKDHLIREHYARIKSAI